MKRSKRPTPRAARSVRGRRPSSRPPAGASGLPARWTGLLAFALLLGTMTYALAEDYILSTYYPSPRGVYDQLRTTGTTLLGTSNVFTGGAWTAPVGISMGAVAPRSPLTVGSGNAGATNRNVSSHIASNGSIAIWGRSDGSVSGVTPSVGVYGDAEGDATSIGVRGVSTGGTGVRGEVQNGTGVLGVATTGKAVRGQAQAAGGYAGFFEGVTQVDGTGAGAVPLRINNSDVAGSSVLEFWNDATRKASMRYFNSGGLNPDQLRLQTELGTAPIVLLQNGAERMRVASNGRVGIGVLPTGSPPAVTPLADLHVQSSPGIAWPFLVQDSANNNLLAVSNNGTSAIGTNSIPVNTRLTIVGTGNTSATTALNVRNLDGTDILNVRNDQRVGIRTNAPGAALDVNGSLIVRPGNSITLNSDARTVWPLSDVTVLQTITPGNLLQTAIGQPCPANYKLVACSGRFRGTCGGLNACTFAGSWASDSGGNPIVNTLLSTARCSARTYNGTTMTCNGSDAYGPICDAAVVTTYCARVN